jgi:hypothetical protein
MREKLRATILLLLQYDLRYRSFRLEKNNYVQEIADICLTMYTWAFRIRTYYHNSSSVSSSLSTSSQYASSS